MDPAPNYPIAGARIWVAGHRGRLGACIVDVLRRSGANVLTVERAELDLRDGVATDRWVAKHSPDGVLIAAGRVGGLKEHLAHPAAMLLDNLAVRASLLAAAARHRVPRVVVVGTGAIYPSAAPQPLHPSSLHMGPPDAAHRAYAAGMLAAVEYVRALRRECGLDYVSVLPTALFGPGGWTDAARGQVVHALIARCLSARRQGLREIVVWGTGEAQRDFLHVADGGTACAVAYARYSNDEPLNIGSGEDVSIARLAHLIKAATGFQGRIRFDPSQPEGAPRRVLDVGALRALGWAPTLSLATGIRETVAWMETLSPEA